MSLLALLCPSRSRVDKLCTSLQSVIEKKSDEHVVKMFVYLDNDDIQLEEYFDNEYLLEQIEKNNLCMMSGPPYNIGRSWNILAEKAANNIVEKKIVPFEFYAMYNDDLVVESQNFDKILLEKFEEIFPDKVGIIFGDDTINGSKHCAFPMVNKQWIDILGYFTPEHFEFFANDTWIYEIARRINRIHYVPEVIIKHNHWSITREKDNTTKRHRDDTNNQRNRRDLVKFNQLEYKKKEDVQKLLGYINSQT